MKTLRLTHRRADVAALWIVVVTFTAACTAVIAFALGADSWWAFGLGAGFAVLLPRALGKDGVGSWNRAVRFVTRLLSAVTMRLYFYLFFLSAGRAGSKMRVAPPQGGGSFWTDCRSFSHEMDLIDSAQVGRGRWLLDLIAFARRSGNGWLLLLAPFFFTLMILGDEEEDTTPPTSTYTLY